MSAPAHAVPYALSARWMQPEATTLLVSFSLSPLSALSPALVAVARLADRGLSNHQIAVLRGTSVNTIARQMADILKALRVGSRLGLATLPELGA